MPGCYADAVAVANGDVEKINAEKISNTEGGDDCSRSVYRIGDVVYKIDGGRPDNTIEFEILTELAEYDWAPPVSLFDVEGTPVLCMPYYRSTGDFISDGDLSEADLELEACMRRKGKTYPGSDLHAGNYRATGPGKFVVIDAAGNFNL